MRCHFSEKDEDTSRESEPSDLNFWASDNLHGPSVLKSVDNLNGIDKTSYSEDLSTLYSLDSVSQSYKRKILECEKEDFEERFSKIQRKRQMLRATAKANLVVDDDDDDYDEESEIYEQMEWIEEGNGMTLHLWKDENVDVSFKNIKSCGPIMYIPKLNWREERRHLLRISMAKIRGVDDPETYLRRSVLINNTVKRLQRDVAVNYRYHAITAPTHFQESTAFQSESSGWDLQNSGDGVVKHNPGACSGFDYRLASENGSIASYNYNEVQAVTPCNFHLSLFTPFSSDKSTDSFQAEVLHNSSVFPKNFQDDQSLCDPSLSCRTLKPASPVHLFSSQPCGLQYRSAHEDTNNEYHESSSSSSILDSVVYHSLIASLET